MTTSDPSHRTPTPGFLPPPSIPPRRSDAPGPLAPQDTPAEPAGFSPERALAEQLGALEAWTLVNERDSKKPLLRLCLLKLPAFLCAAAASAVASFGHMRAVVILGAVCALCIAIDAAWMGPGDVHKRAVRDLRQLQNAVKLRWDKTRLAHPDPRDHARTGEALAILDVIQARRDEISRYLASPPAGPGAEAMQ
jgi:hypothetical protein